MIEQVRRFNRTVTQRIGALDDAFLARDRPLGQARLLWEIGPDGSDVDGCAPGSTWTPATSAGCCASLESDELIRRPAEPRGRRGCGRPA